MDEASKSGCTYICIQNLKGAETILFFPNPTEDEEGNTFNLFKKFIQQNVDMKRNQHYIRRNYVWNGEVVRFGVALLSPTELTDASETSDWINRYSCVVPSLNLQHLQDTTQSKKNSESYFTGGAEIISMASFPELLIAKDIGILQSGVGAEEQQNAEGEKYLFFSFYIPMNGGRSQANWLLKISINLELRPPPIEFDNLLTKLNNSPVAPYTYVAMKEGINAASTQLLQKALGAPSILDARIPKPTTYLYYKDDTHFSGNEEIRQRTNATIDVLSQATLSPDLEMLAENSKGSENKLSSFGRIDTVLNVLEPLLCDLSCHGKMIFLLITNNTETVSLNIKEIRIAGYDLINEVNYPITIKATEKYGFIFNIIEDSTGVKIAPYRAYDASQKAALEIQSSIRSTALSKIEATCKIKWCMDTSPDIAIWSQVSIMIPNASHNALEVELLEEVRYRDRKTLKLLLKNNEPDEVDLTIHVSDELLDPKSATYKMLVKRLTYKAIPLTVSLHVGNMKAGEYRSVELSLFKTCRDNFDKLPLLIVDELTSKQYLFTCGA